MAGALGEHDFGTVLADGRPIGILFRVRNESTRPLRLVASMALKPCCSVMGPLPDVVPAGEAVFVAGWLRTKDRDGPQSATFVIRTDDPARPEIRLGLSAHLARKMEWREPTEESEAPVRGQPWNKRIELVYRRLADQPVSDAKLIVPAGVQVVKRDQIERRDTTLDLIETSQVWDLIWPASGDLGRQRSEVRAQWPDGSESVYELTYDVLPMIQTMPRALIVPSGQASEATVILYSSGGVFRVVDVRGEYVNGFRIVAGEGEARQEVRIEFTSLPSRPTVSKIEVETDQEQETRIPLTAC